ncbi:MAG TPA: ABC transporter permease [Planctomycetaceae bacterium]|nr:ABC transporter permease [Planctomycetaceae bacterium]
MPFWKIAWRNMEQRSLASSLTGLSMALGVALMILVIVIHQVVVKQFEGDAEGYHLIVGGGKAGDVQLVMNTVFHIGEPIYPIPYSYYKQFVDGEYAPFTSVAIPYCIGDSYHINGLRFRVVATTPDLFEKLAYGANEDGSDKRYEFSSGRNFRSDHFFEAVIGAVVASKSGLEVGDTFQPTHGMSSKGEKHIEFEIVGVLKSTGTSNDRAIFANMEGFYLLDGHAMPLEEGEEEAGQSMSESGMAVSVDPKDPNRGRSPLPERQREVTSILVRCESDTAMMYLDNAINKGKDRTTVAVKPGCVVQDMLDNIIGPMQLVLLILTVLIVIVAGISILVSIYNSMSERSHDIAVMRALGASRTAVMGIILVESILLALLGGVSGVALGHVVLAAISPYVESQSGITLGFWQFSWQEGVLIPSLVVFAVLVGYLPALTAYRTDVGRALGSGRY